MNKQILSNIWKSTLFKGGTILGQFYLVPLTIELLDKELFGVWVTIVAIISWLTFLDFGMGNGLRNILVKSVSEDDILTSRKLITSAYTFILAISLIIIAVAIVFLGGFQLDILSIAIHQDLIRKCLLISVILFSFKMILMTINFINHALQKSSMNDFLNFITIIVTIFIIQWLKSYHAIGLEELSIVFGVVPLIVYLVYTLYFFSKNNHLKPYNRLAKYVDTKELMSSGISFFIIQLSSTLIFTLPLFLISSWFSPASVAEFNIANKMYGMIYTGFSIILTPIWSAFTKAYVEKKFEWILTTIKKLQWMSLGGVLIIFSLYSISSYIYKIWLGENFIIANSMNTAASIFNVSIILILPFNYLLNGLGELRYQLILSVFNLVIYIPVSYLFCYVFNLGAVGVVYTSCFIFLINYTLTYLFINRHLYGTRLSAQGL